MCGGERFGSALLDGKEFRMRARWALVVAASLVLAGCQNANKMSHQGDEDEEGDEVKVAFADLPQPVKATLEKESNNARIDTVDKEMKDGKTIYEADAMVNGQNWEIKVAEDGTLVKKRLDNEDEKKEMNEKKGEKEDKD
jgi:hypothetical protein